MSRQQPMTTGQKALQVADAALHTVAATLMSYGLAAKLNAAAANSAGEFRGMVGLNNVAACLDPADLLFMAGAAPYAVRGLVAAGANTFNGVRGLFAKKPAASAPAATDVAPTVVATGEQSRAAASTDASDEASLQQTLIAGSSSR